MADARGRSTSWTVAAVAAPVVAGLFAGLTAWATHEDPLHPSSSADASGVPTRTPVATAAPDPALTQLQKSLAADEARINALAAKVAAVRRQAAAATRASKGTAAGSGAATASGTGGTTTTRHSSGSTGASSSGSHSSSSGSAQQHPGTGTRPRAGSVDPRVDGGIGLGVTVLGVLGSA